MESQKSSVTGEIEKDYEERMQNKLVGIVYDVLKVIITEPEPGFKRIFKEADFPSIWPRGLPSVVEIDFFGHVGDIKELRSMTPPTNPYVQVVQSAATETDRSELHIVHPGISPEKGGNIEVTCKYALAEITAGGRKAAKSKADQLEKDCRIAMMKSGKTDVLDAVVLAIIVNPNDHAEIVFNCIRENARRFPNLIKLMRAGRLFYIINRETISTVLAEINSKLEETTSKLEETTSRLEGKLEETTSKLEETTARLLNLQDSLGEMKALLKEFMSKK